MEHLSQALNLVPQPMPSADPRLHRRRLGTTPENTVCIPTVSMCLRDLAGQLGTVQSQLKGKTRLYAGGRAATPANQIHTESRLPFVHFRHKTASTVRKVFFIVRKGQSRTINKPNINARREWRHSDCMITSLANTNSMPTA